MDKLAKPAFSWAQLLLVASLLLATSCGQAPERSSKEDGNVSVRLSPAPDQRFLLAEFTLSEPVAQFAFEPLNTRQRKSDWRAPDNGWQFDGDTVSRADNQLFDRFTLQLNPDTQFFPRSYVAIDQIDQDSWLILLSALKSNRATTTVVLHGFADNVVAREGDQTRVAPFAPIATNNTEQLLYVGSAAHIYHMPNAALIVGQEVPVWLRSRLIAMLTHVVTPLHERFDQSPLNVPTLYVTYQPDLDGKNWKGGAFDQSVIALRLRGIDLTHEDNKFTDELFNVVAHEAVHLWIGRLYQSSVTHEQPWLHEGAAEYVADRLWMNPEGFQQEAELRLNKCLLTLGTRSLDDPKNPVHDQAAYHCGFVIQLAAELASVRAGNGDIVELWRKVFSDSQSMRFTPGAFIAEAGSRGGQGFTLLATHIIDYQQRKAYSKLPGLLSRLGVRAVAQTPTKQYGRQIRKQFMMPLLAAACTGTYGYKTLEDHLQLDTGMVCAGRTISEEKFSFVGEYHLIEAPFQAYQYVRAACATGGVVKFYSASDKSSLDIPCRAEILDLPTIYTLSGVAELLW